MRGSALKLALFEMQFNKDAHFERKIEGLMGLSR